MAADGKERETIATNTVKEDSGLCSVKYLSLIILMIQNTSLILTIRYSRTLPGDMYISSTAVVFAELFKLLACLVILLVQKGGRVKEWASYLYASIIGQPVDTLKLSVPALIYVIQNNLQYVAISNLDAATFQVSYQLKILTTALFSVVMLRRSLSKAQWVSLVILFMGISLVQLQQVNTSATKTKGPAQNPTVGFTAVLTSCLCSGFAGVYFEKMVKGGQTSIWLRNVQLGIYGFTLGLIGMQINDGAKIAEKGFLFGYSNLVWVVICMQAFGGLLVALVVKFADNILKGFATSFAIILSCFASVYLFEFHMSTNFLVGTTLVILAIYIYSKMPYQASPQINGVRSVKIKINGKSHGNGK